MGSAFRNSSVPFFGTILRRRSRPESGDERSQSRPIARIALATGNGRACSRREPLASRSCKARTRLATSPEVERKSLFFDRGFVTFRVTYRVQKLGDMGNMVAERRMLYLPANMQVPSPTEVAFWGVKALITRRS